MIDRAAIDQLITELQQLSADYSEHQTFAARHARSRASPYPRRPPAGGPNVSSGRSPASI